MTPPVAPPASKFRSFVTRTLSTLVMFAVFVGIMWAGHIPCAVLMYIFQAMIVRELFTLARSVDEDMTMPLFRTQQWAFFFVSTFYLYGRFIRKNLALTPLDVDSRVVTFLSWVLSRHLIISYSFYTAALVLFVLTLKKDQYGYQFKQLAWTHLIVFFTVVPSSFFVPLMFEGLVWFFLPCGLIIVNDIMAYLAGVTCGRTPLIALSPKKTWEGFVGGAVGTMVASFALTWVFAQFRWMYCPRVELGFGPLDCERPAAFVTSHFRLTDLWQVLPDFIVEDVRPAFWLLPAAVQRAAASVSWTCMPAQMHAVALAAFASIIGPFGGFFASGFKRALGIKDFGDSIPGHGGVTDRFDCQMMMGVFAYIYFHFYIAGDTQEEEVLDGLLDLPAAGKLSVFEKLGGMLVVEGLLDGSALSNLLRDAGAQ